MKRLTTSMLLAGTRHFLVMEPALSTQQTLLATLEMGSIDITSYGVNDTCNKKIRIPVAADVRD